MPTHPTFNRFISGGLLLMTVAATHASQALDTLEKAYDSTQRFVLDNGLTGLIYEDHSAPVAAVQIWVGTGSIDEEEWSGAGLSHYIEHMIFKGTKKRKPGDITREINDAGGDINAYTSLDRTVFHTDLPSANWRVGLDVLSDAVMNASFPEEEWAREKEVILREMAMGADSPDRVLGKLLWATAYRVHPYRNPVIGYEDVFRTMDREDLVEFHKRNYTPDNMIVVVSGDVDAQEVEAAIRDVFGSAKRRARAPVILPQEPRQSSARYQRSTGDYKLTRLQRAWHTVSLNDADAPALDILAAVAGNGRSSRLVQELREKQALVFDINAWSHTPKDPGLFGISAQFDPENEAAVLAALDTQVQSWADGNFTKEEIDKARRMVLADELASLQTANGMASSIASGEFYAANPSFSLNYLKALNTVTSADLARVARRYLTEENEVTVVLAPEDKEKEQLQKEEAPTAGPIEKLELPGGLRMLVREDRRLPFVWFSLVLKGGALSETPDNAGITELTAELLTRGAGKWDAASWAQAIEQRGGSLSAFSGYNSLGLTARCFREDADFFADLLATALQEPHFDPGEVSRQRERQLADLARSEEQPFFQAQMALRKGFYGDHPYSWTPLGTRKGLANLDAEDLRAHFKELLSSDRLVVSVFGDISPDEAKALFEQRLSQLPKTPALEPPPSPLASAQAFRSEQHLPREQAILLCGYPGVDLNSIPDVDVLEVLNSTLSGLSSDLGIKVRDERGLVYYVGSYQFTGLQQGLLVLYAGTRAEAADEVEGLMQEEINRICTGGLRDEEIDRAVAQLVSRQERKQQKVGSLCQTVALNELLGRGYDWTLRARERFGSVTKDQITQIAKRIFDNKQKGVSLVLPEAGETPPQP